METRVEIKYISGLEHALWGIGLSYGITAIDMLMDIDTWERLIKISKKLCGKEGGHNKFLESINIGLVVQAPRYWWQEFDTYRIGVTKQSESTMHTITKRNLTQNDFADEILESTLTDLNNIISYYRDEKDPYDMQYFFELIKSRLPEGFLQTRAITTNFKVLRHIFKQRKSHRLCGWKQFIHQILSQVSSYDLYHKNGVYYTYLSEGIF